MLRNIYDIKLVLLGSKLKMTKHERFAFFVRFTIRFYVSTVREKGRIAIVSSAPRRSILENLEEEEQSAAISGT